MDCYKKDTEIVKPYVIKGYIPIVIGGGHNNAYPIIKTISESFNQAIHVFNLDPHADCRALEGRHSGNSFSYAKEHGFIDQYTVFGLHKNYNSEFIYSYLEKNNFKREFECVPLNDQGYTVPVKQFTNGQKTQGTYVGGSNTCASRDSCQIQNTM